MSIMLRPTTDWALLFSNVCMVYKPCIRASNRWRWAGRAVRSCGGSRYRMCTRSCGLIRLRARRRSTWIRYVREYAIMICAFQNDFHMVAELRYPNSHSLHRRLQEGRKRSPPEIPLWPPCAGCWFPRPHQMAASVRGRVGCEFFSDPLPLHLQLSEIRG